MQNHLTKCVKFEERLPSWFYLCCYIFFDPWLRPEGPYEIASVCPSLHLSVRFSELAHWFFLKLGIVLGTQIVVTAGFFGKNPHQAKMNKNGRNFPQNMVFGLFKRFMSLVLSGFCVKRKFLGSLTFWKNCMLGNNMWFSSYSQKLLLAYEISVFLNCQYFTNRLIPEFDFWHVDRHEWKKLIDRFSEKSHLGK